MIPVYNAQSTFDAQLVQDLLSSAGITAHVFGRNAAGAIPELPDRGLIRVMVEEAEAEQARELIQDWQTGPALEEEGVDLMDSLSLEDEV